MLNPKVLMLGDSITHGFKWQDVMSFAEVTNLAVPGYSTDDLVQQLDSIDLTNFPAISLLIGTNDFGNVQLDRSGEEVGHRVAQIVNQILSKTTTSQLVLNTIMPRSEMFTPRIRTANSYLSDIAHERLVMLDTWPVLAIEDSLRAEFLLLDGFDVHLNQYGYAAWAQKLVPLIEHLVQ